MTRFPPECGTTHLNEAINLALVCAKTRGHQGKHSTRRGTTWNDPAPVRSPDADPHHCGKPGTWSDADRYGYTVNTWCRRTAGHDGDHHPNIDQMPRP